MTDRSVPFVDGQMACAPAEALPSGESCLILAKSWRLRFEEAHVDDVHLGESQKLDEVDTALPTFTLRYE